MIKAHVKRIQCNTNYIIHLLIYDITLLTEARKAQNCTWRTCLGNTDAVVLQSIHNVRRTCSRSLHSDCLGSNPYSFPVLYALQAERSNKSASVNTCMYVGLPVYLLKCIWNRSKQTKGL